MKTLRIFLRDLKVSLRQFVTLWIMVIPILLAVIVNLATPGITDTPLHIAMLRESDARMAAYLSQYAKVELFDTQAAAEARVLERDDVPAILPDGTGAYEIVAQGNEPDHIIKGAQMFLAFASHDVQADPSKVAFHDFGRTAPPLKIILTTALVVLVTILSGMLIATNIVDEKADRTLRVIRVSPVPVSSFVVGKSLIGVFNTLVCTVLCILAAGFLQINFAQVLLIALCASFISFVVGFLTGLSSEDFISAIASLKILMLPAVAPILAIELLGERWQWLFWWSPFYWAYDGIKGVLAQTAAWPTVLRDAGLTIAISLVVYAVFYPKIRQKMK